MPQKFRLTTDRIISTKCLLNCALCKNHIEAETEPTGTSVTGKQIGILNLLGGDPLLAEDLEAKLFAFKTRHKFINIFTPLYKKITNPGILAKLNILVFIFSPMEYQHNEIAGRPDAFTNTLANIYELSRLGMRPILHFFITKENAGLVPEMHDMARRLDLELLYELNQNFCSEKFTLPEINEIRKFARSRKRYFICSENQPLTKLCLYSSQNKSSLNELRLAYASFRLHQKNNC